MEIPAKKGFYSIVLASYLGFAGCGGGGSVSRPPQPSLSQTLSLVNDVDIHYAATLRNVRQATRTITHNGAQIGTTTITFSPYNETLENMQKGEYRFDLTAGSLSDTDSVTIPNYLPAFNSAGLETNLNEAYEGSSKTFNLETLISDKNPEDTVSLNSARSLDEKTIVSLDGYNLIVKSNGVGPYQVEVNYGTDEGGKGSSIISGNITPVPEQIVFWSNKDHGAGELYTGDIVNNQLINTKRLTNNVTNDAQPAWSPNGKTIAFVSNSDLKQYLGIWTMDSDGTNKIKITSDAISALTPVWCSDNKIYFEFVDYNLGKTGIASIKADGTEFTKLIEEPFLGVITGNPSYSSSGLEIAFDTSKTGNSEIDVVNSDGSNRRHLTNNPNEDAQPRWSPDNKIYFITDRDTPGTGEFNLYSMNPDGTGVQRLTDFPGEELDLSLSSDLTRCLLTHGPVTGPWHIYTMNRDGTGLTQLTTEGQNRYPAWRPRQ